MTPALPLGPDPLRPARFLERPNRFLVRCRLEESVPVTGGARLEEGVCTEERARGEENAHGEESVPVEAHLPDPGRLAELLVPGRRVWLRPEDGTPARKTAWTAVLAETPDGRGLVSLDTTVPNRLVGKALRAGALEELPGWELERPEFPLGRSRIDFLLGNEEGRRLALEVKSVTLVEDEVGRFPDAVTARGARHVRELAGVVERPGWRAAVLFLVQRGDADRVVAARDIDPDFAEALSVAAAAGVRLLGRRCRVYLDRVELGGRIPAQVG